MDEQRSTTEAIAIAGSDIVAVGTDQQLLAITGPDTRVVDVDGRMIVPGIVDPHTHMVQVAAPDVAAMLDGQRQLARWGVTTAGMPTVTPDQLDAFRRLADRGEIDVRSHLYVTYNGVCGDSAGGFHLEPEFSQDPALRLAVAGVKIFADGGVCNAPAVSFRYPDSVPDELRDAGWIENGSLYADAEEIAAVVREVDAAGGQVVIHAIGDVGIASALQGLTAARADGLDRRHRLDHNSMVGLLDAATRALYTTGDVIPVVQLMPWAQACEVGRTDLWASILPEPALVTIEDRRFISDANPEIVFAWHGDGPFVPASPLAQLYSAVTGGAADGEGTVCDPWPSIPTAPIVDAFAMLTVDAAAAMLIEDRVGSLEVGKAADVLVLDQPLDHDDPVVGLAENRPLITIAAGRVLHCEAALCEAIGADATSSGVPEPGPTGPVDWVEVEHPVIERLRASRVHDGDTGVEKVADGDSGTSWNSGDSSPQWLEIDLGGLEVVAEIRLEIEQDPLGFTIHRVMAGSDPDPADLVAELTGDTASAQVLTVPIGSAVRYIRIDTPGSPAWVAWREIEVVLAE